MVSIGAVEMTTQPNDNISVLGLWVNRQTANGLIPR